MPDDLDEEYAKFVAAKGAATSTADAELDREYAEFVASKRADPGGGVMAGVGLSRGPAAPVDDSPWPRRYKITRKTPTVDARGNVVGGSHFTEDREFASQEELDAYTAPPSRPSQPAFVEAPLGLAMTEDGSVHKDPVGSPRLTTLADMGKTAAAAIGGGIIDVGDRYLGKAQEFIEAGIEHLPIGGKGARVADLSREGLSWEERKRTAGLPRETPRPVSEAADAINRGLGTGAPTVAEAKAALRKDPAVDLGFRGEEAVSPAIADTGLMLAGGGLAQRGLMATKMGKALATTRTGRALIGTSAFGGGGVLVDPTHPKEAVVNGALAYVGMKAGEFVAAPFLAGIMSRAEQASRGVSPLFIKAMSGVGEGLGQSLVPQVHDGEWRSALLEGDAVTVATNVALNAIFTAGAPDIPLGVKQAYIKGRAGEVPPQYRARLDALAGPIYDSARGLSAEAAKAKAGARPWTMADDVAARSEIHAQGATGRVAEAQLAKAKAGTYDADAVTPEMLAEGKAGSTGEAADTLIGQDRAGFAADTQARIEQGLPQQPERFKGKALQPAEFVSGPRETEALEMGEAAAEGQATREAARAGVEPGDPAMLSRPLGVPPRGRKAAPVPEAPPVAPVAPEPAREAPVAPVPEGHVRLYRGEPETLPNVPEAVGVLPHRGDRGTWFSPNISYAEQFGKRIKYVDLPKADYEQHVRSEAEEARLYGGMIRDPANVRLDYEVAGAARDYQRAPAAPREEVIQPEAARVEPAATPLVFTPKPRGRQKSLAPAVQLRNLTREEFLAGAYEDAATYESLRSNEGQEAAQLAFGLHSKGIATIDTHARGDEIIMRLHGDGSAMRESGLDRVPGVRVDRNPEVEIDGTGGFSIHVNKADVGRVLSGLRAVEPEWSRYAKKTGNENLDEVAGELVDVWESLQPKKSRAPRLKSAATLEAEATKGAGLSQLVRREGGIDLTLTNLTGEVNGLRLKESGTTGLVSPKGGGRSKSVQRLMDAAREEGFDLEGWTETQFVERVLADAQGDRTLNPATVDDDALGKAEIARMREADDALWADAPPGAREKYDAETKARIDAILQGKDEPASEVPVAGPGKRADLEAYLKRTEDSARFTEIPANRARFEKEARAIRKKLKDMDAAEAAFQTGETVYGITRDGTFAQGTVVRETGKSIIVDTPNGQRSIPKTDVQRPPKGVYLGSGLGGAQPIIEDVGKYIVSGAKSLGRYSQAFADWVTMKTAPKMLRSAPEASQYAGGIVNSHTTSHLVAPVWMERVFGENPTAEAMAKFGHAAGEWQFTAKKKSLQAQLDATTDPVARGRIEDKLGRVGTVVGAEGSPFETQADLDAYMATPEWKAQSEAWREMWNKASIVDGDSLPGPERMYRDLAKNGDHDPDLFVSDERDVLRVNMKPMEPDEDGGTRPVYRTATGSLRAPILKGHAFSREFTGGAAKYDFDPAALIQNTYQRVRSEWLKPKMYDALVNAGDAQFANTKDPDWKPPTKIKGENAVPYRITDTRTIIKDGKAFTVPGKTLYVREGLQGELNQTLRTAPASKQIMPLRVINTAALTGIADNMWNLMLDAAIPGAAPGHIPGRIGQQAGLANNIVGILKQLRYTFKRPKDYNERALRLSADAAWRGERDGNAWTKDYVLSRLVDMRNPLKIPGVAFEATAGGLSKIAQRVHEAGRLVLDEAFTNLVNAGLAKNTPTNRRDFVNRLGQYAGRAMDRMTEQLRDLGVQPFVVAKKKSLAEIGRKVTFSPGVEATSKTADLEMRAGQLMKWLSFAVATGLINTAYTGSPTGRPGTPLGNIDTGSNDPRTKVPQSWPWFGDMTGFGPATRASGAAGFFKAKQEGLTNEQAAGDAAMGPMNAVLLKWLSSPVSDFLARTASGETIPQALGGGGGPKAPPAEPGENALASRAGFALRQGAQLGGVATQAIDAVAGTKLSPEYAQDATGEFFDLLKSFAPKRGTSPEILEDMKDIRDGKAAGNWAEWAAQQRRNFPSTDEWWKWVEREVKGTNWPERARYYTLQSLSRKRGG